MLAAAGEDALRAFQHLVLRDGVIESLLHQLVRQFHEKLGSLLCHRLVHFLCGTYWKAAEKRRLQTIEAVTGAGTKRKREDALLVQARSKQPTLPLSILEHMEERYEAGLDEQVEEDVEGLAEVKRYLPV